MIVLAKSNSRQRWYYMCLPIPIHDMRCHRFCFYPTFLRPRLRRLVSPLVGLVLGRLVVPLGLVAPVVICLVLVAPSMG